ncbi:hypothetical protein QTP88_026237 [Uroleucon formosanum]
MFHNLFYLELENYFINFSLTFKRNIKNNVSNTLTVNEGNSSYTFQCPISSNFEDYWVIQHYKIKTIEDIPLIERSMQSFITQQIKNLLTLVFISHK